MCYNTYYPLTEVFIEYVTLKPIKFNYEFQLSIAEMYNISRYQ